MRLKPLAALATLAFAATSSPLLAQSRIQALPISNDKELNALAKSWDNLTDLFDVPGAAIAIIKDGQTYIWTHGNRTPESRSPVNKDTMFYIASITKTYTAAAIVKLAEEGELDLNDPITKYLPDIKLGDSVDPSSITIEDLITHRKGINSTPVVVLDAYSGEITDERYDYWLAQGQVKGSTEYTNVNLTLAGRIIEQVAGVSWRDYLQQAFFTPAGMTRTTGYASEIYTDDNAAFPTVWDGENWVVSFQMKTDRTMHAAGGLGTTAVDAAKWIQLQINEGTINNEDILSPESIAAMHEQHSSLDKPKGTIRISTGFGHGWNVGSFLDQTPLSSHGGGYSGTSAWYGYLPEYNAGIAILINGSGLAGGWQSIVAVEAFTNITGLEPDWNPRENFSQRVKQMKEAGDAPRIDQEHTAMPTDHLTRPLDLYTGWFHNEHLGTLVIKRSDNTLSIRLGDYYPTVGPGKEPNTAIITDMTDTNSILRFILSETGYIEAVELTDDSLGDPLLFIR